jgi:TRAP-type mannitol/chloroaromatic compound transport system permease small subunit
MYYQLHCVTATTSFHVFVGLVYGFLAPKKRPRFDILVQGREKLFLVFIPFCFIITYFICHNYLKTAGWNINYYQRKLSDIQES